MLPVLRAAAQGERRVADVEQEVAAQFGLSAEEREQLLPSGRQIRTVRAPNAPCDFPLKSLAFSPKNGPRTVRLLSCHHNQNPRRPIRSPSALRQSANRQARA
ncbi:MAG TPA: winged helix-turn-helix domain-containing protein [Caulobacteraceae bacterium]|nr:winged helix-turn-helix domain-containing protein [Caulobacteraceae bacterium]